MLCSYVMDGAVCGFGESGSPASYKLTDTLDSGCYLLWEPDQSTGLDSTSDFNDGANYPNNGEGIGPLHNSKGGNALTTSGTVTFLSSITFSNLANGTVKNDLWWSPLTPNGR